MNLCLNRSKSNWEEWCLQMTLITNCHGFTDWLDSSFPQPDITTNTKGHHAWRTNDCSLKVFMLQHISQTDYKIVATLSTAATIFKSLRKCHEDLSTHTQVTLITKAFNTRFCPGTAMTHIIEEIDLLHTTILAIGPLNGDHLRTVFLINALGKHYPQLQSMIQGSYDNPSFSSRTVVQAIQHEEDLIHNHEEQGLQAPSITLAAQSHLQSKVICAHCKCTSHLTKFCIQPGGKMEGKSLDDARTAQCAVLSCASYNGHSPQSSSSATPSSLVHITMASPAPTDTVESIEVNGKTYYSAPPASTPPPAPTDFIGTTITAPLPINSTTTFKHHSFEAFTAINGPSHVSLDWSSHMHSLNGVNASPKPVTFSTTHTPVNTLTESPFILDMGTMCHISPIKSDFKSIHPIAPHPITSIGEARVHTTSLGSIKLCIASNHKVVLEDVLFIPTSVIQLVSVLCLNCSGGYTSSFNSNSCWVTNKAGAIIL